ncbi:STAS domain-containing protein [bacterium]|nr:STAS domain-containing protein [bacterium]
MAVKIKIIDNVAIIKVRGIFNGNEESTEIRDQVKKLISEHIHKFVLDLSRVKWMNSHGLGTLMACYSSVQNVNGKIGIAKTPDRIMKIMTISNVHRLFDHFDSLKQAIRYFQ